jgi:hypothetical protein
MTLPRAKEAAILKEWPAEILWENPWTLELVKFYRSGVGAYPYECVNSKKYPSAVIYRANADGTGSWLGSSSLEAIRTGVYKSVA